MDKIVSAISRILVINALPSFPIDEKMLGKVGPVLCQRIEKMPLPVRALIRASTRIFDLAGIVYAGRPFRQQSPAQQQAMVDQWGRSAWAPVRQFIRFYRKFSVYLYFALLEGLE